jgi:hypothetical protein
MSYVRADSRAAPASERGKFSHYRIFFTKHFLTPQEAPLFYGAQFEKR